MQKNYTDGFFNVSEQYGFLPVKPPLESLPVKYNKAQELINNLPELIKDLNKLNDAINGLPEYDVTHETDVFVIQAIFRAYTFMSSAYLLAPAYHNQKDGIYGKALNVLPANLAKPLIIVADKLQVSPWLEYHYAYSLGNYAKLDKSKSLDWQNLKMACSFTGTQDESGFIMNHVFINEKSPDLIKAIHLHLNGNTKDGLKLFYQTLKEMNARRHTMWRASNHKNYNNFRAFIMGIKGNEEIFGPGVIYKTGDESENTYRQYRGQTGAQDDIIPTSDIFSGVIKYYPHNQLTSYLMDLRSYRPKCVQDFFHDLEKDMQDNPIKTDLVYLLAIIDEIYLFRNGHWQFVQKYIMANTRYANATGGTPIISWLPNQIEACLKAQAELFPKIHNKDLNADEQQILSDIKSSHLKKVHLLDEQLAELAKENYNVDRIYNLNIENDLLDPLST